MGKGDGRVKLECFVGGGGGESAEVTLKTVCSNILGDFPNVFNIADVQLVFPVIKTESMNTVLTQELTRFNKLIKVRRQGGGGV